MDSNAWLTLGAIFLSPIVAVAITLWVEGRRRDREGKMAIVRTLMATRHMPSDPNYSTAINLIPVQFSKSGAVREAFKAYQREIRREPAQTPDGQSMLNGDILAAQSKLLSAVLGDVGMTISEADLPVEAYAAGGFVARDNLYLQSLRAQVRIADALEKSAMDQQ